MTANGIHIYNFTHKKAGQKLSLIHIFGRRQQRGLISRPDARPDGGSSYQRFATAYIAMNRLLQGDVRCV